MKLSRFPIVVAATCPTLCCSLRAENWPQWRGPHFDGSTDEKGLPSKWSKESAQWSIAMPGPSAATPAIWDDLVFVTTADNETRTLHAFCLDRKTGKLLWNNQVSECFQRDEKSNFASPSPVVGVDRVFFFYGNGEGEAKLLFSSRWKPSLT